jgi:hypothetical protein
MRFCLECGRALDFAAPELSAPLADPALDESTIGSDSLSPTEPPSYPIPVETTHEPAQLLAAHPRRSPVSTVALRISPSPVISPRGDMADDYPRPSIGPEVDEVDEEALRKAFEKPALPGMVLCRFCKSPLDLAGDFCEQCGAPVAEAMPPGTVRPEQAPVHPVVPAPEPAGQNPNPIDPHLPLGETSTAAAPGQPQTAPAPPVAKPCATATAPRVMPAPSGRPTHPVATPEPPSGLLGRLKDVFTRDKSKKG